MTGTVRGRALALTMIALAQTACGVSQTHGTGAARAAPAPATPTADEVRHATIVGVYDRPVVLKNGRYEGPPFVEGGASRPRLLLIENLVAFGNLDGAVGDEAAALLAENSGGSGERIYLSVIGVRDGAPISLGTIQVGDRTKIRSFGISGAAVVMEVVEAGPTDRACCPTQLAQKAYAMDQGSLTLKSSVVTGKLSLALLEGAQWTVLEIDGQGLPGGPKLPTATIEGPRIAGFSGCNRYMAAITETSPGEIAIGSVAGTRMACPGPETEIESRYLAALGAAKRYTFVAGRLLLWGMEGSAPRSVLLKRE